jgi:hypothetical protein
MSDKHSLFLTLLLVCGAITTACQESRDESVETTANGADASGKPAPAIDADRAAVSPGKPTAPVSIHYTVIGAAVVGQPVSVNLQVSSTEPDEAVTLEYRTSDTSAMLFPESQAQRIDLAPASDNGPRVQQVTVIPQREGRLFLIVSAAVETANGTLFRSLAIPIQVGAGASPPEVNGELQEMPDGETVISMPASETDGG